MNSPFEKLASWLQKERGKGNLFPQGAVLCTVSNRGEPRSRVVSTMLDEHGVPKFHTSPTSRKVEDIESNNTASLTYSFQGTLRSISIEGVLSPLPPKELDADWLKFDTDFRRHYLIFGECSGSEVDALDSLRERRDSLPLKAEDTRPDSFIGFKFADVKRVSFYSVMESDFAISVLFERDESNGIWSRKTIVP